MSVVGFFALVLFIVVIVAILLSGVDDQSSNVEMQSTSNNSNSLNNFRITANKYSEKWSGKVGRWILPDESVTVKGVKITGGWFYFGDYLKYEDSNSYEVSIIRPNLSTKESHIYQAGRELKYLLSYESLDPPTRGEYLNWLSSNRDDPETSKYFVMLYVCGFERRLTHDSKHDMVSYNEYENIDKELIRLFDIYGSDFSISKYILKLRKYAWVVFNHDKNAPNPKELLTTEYEFSPVAKLLLGKLIKDKKPIPADLAIAWLINSQEHHLRTPFHRCPEEFHSTFKILYEAKYGFGIRVPENESRFLIHYSSKNRDLKNTHLTLDLPDVSVLNKPVKQIWKVASDCLDLLSPYSTYLGPDIEAAGRRRNSLSAKLLLPDELLKAEEYKDVNSLRLWLQNQIIKYQGICTANQIYSHFSEDERPSKLLKKNRLYLMQFLSKFDLGLAPDPNHQNDAFDFEDSIVIYKINKADSDDDFPHKLCFSIRLCIMFLKNTNQITEASIKYIHKSVIKKSLVSSDYQSFIKAYCVYRLNSTENKRGLKAQAKILNDNDISLLISHLVHLANMDGYTDPEELKLLQYFYSLLGRNPDDAITGIHNLNTRSYSDSEKQIIPERKTINHNLLKSIEHETSSVQNLLSDIFTEDTADKIVSSEVIQDKNNIKIDHNEPWMNLFTILSNKVEWPINEVEDLCSDLDVMMSGVVDQINEWSIEETGEPVIEIGSSVRIDMELVDELSA